MRSLLLIALLGGRLVSGQDAPQDLRLEVPTSVVAGTVMAVRASPTPVERMRVQLLDAAARPLGWHEAGALGEVEITIAEPGAYTLRWQARDGTEVLAPFHVLARRPGWFTAWWTVPVGLLLAGLGVRRAASARAR